jgi:histidyl-tRNA synthetase
VTDETQRAASETVAQALRSRGIPTEVAPDAAKFGKQIRHADHRGIPFVWFPDSSSDSSSVKDIRSGHQVDADPQTWTPPPDDLHPQVMAAADIEEQQP